MEPVGFRRLSTMEQQAGSTCALSTGDSQLDEVCGGGFVRGSVTEIAGVAGCGKSQLCMQLTAHTLQQRLNVIYIDTEQGSSLKRMKEMYRGLSRNAASQDFYGRLLMASPTCLRKLEIDLMKLIEDGEKMKKTSLLIVDSIAAFFRGENTVDIIHQLNKLAGLLCRIATESGIAVVWTNHATTKEGSDGEWESGASLGQSWQHVSATSLWLEREGDERWISLIKCAWAAEQRRRFAVEGGGLRIIQSI